MGYGHGRAYAFQALGRSLAELPKLFADLRQQRDAALLDKIGSMAMPEGAARSPVQAQPPPFDPAQPDPEQGKGTGLPLTDPSAAPPPTPAAAPSGMPMSGGPMSGAARLRFMADQLRKQGKGALAQQLDAKAQLADKAEWDAQKSRFAAITESFGSRKSGLDLLGRMANGVTDQRGADTARAAMLTVMQQSGFSEPEIQYAQEVAGKPGDPFDPKAWANVVNLTQTHGQTIADQHTALQVVGQSYTNAENKTKAEEAAFTATVKHLLTAPQQYAANRALAVAVDPRMAQVLPPEWNADTETRLTGYLEGIDKTAGLTGTFAGKPTVAQQNATSTAMNQMSAGTGGGVRADPDALRLVGTQYRVLGAQGIPTRIGEADKVAIIKEAAAQVKALGQSSAQSVQKQAAFKADAGALAQMRKMSSSAEAFDIKALAQADIIDGLSPKVNRGSSPMLNNWLLQGKKEVVGDTDTALLYNAIQTFSNEYAKIMEGSTGSVAASSDSARKAAENLVKASYSKKTLAEVVGLMRREMQLTLDGYNVTIDHITNRMGGGPTSGSTPNPNQTEKTVTVADLQAIATRNKTTLEQEKARATAAGYTIK